MLDLSTEGLAGAIGVTPNHPIWFYERREFVRADALAVGESLLDSQGARVAVREIIARSGRTEVLNIEVDGEHVYHVSSAGVLVHNKCADGLVPRNTASNIAGHLAAPVGQMADHHNFTRQFEKFCSARGVKIDDFTITGEHRITHLRGIHGRGNIGQFPGRWKERWKEFTDNNPNATAKDIHDFGGRLMDEVGLGHLPIHPFSQ